LGHPRERGAEEGSSEAVADDVDLVLAGRLADRIERRKRPFEHVILERLAGMRPSGLTQEITNTVGPCSTAQTTKEFPLAPDRGCNYFVDPRRDHEKRPFKTVSVLGAYWMSCMSSLWKTTLRGRA